MAASWICTKCGATANSKCVNKRTVFPENQLAALFTNQNIFRVVETPFSTEIFFNCSTYENAGQDKMTAFRTLKRVINAYHEDDVRTALCEHHWILNSKTETTCELGHEHDNKSTYEPTEVYKEEVSLEDTLKRVIYYATEITKSTLISSTDDPLENSVYSSKFNAINSEINKLFKELLDMEKCKREYLAKELLDRGWKFNSQSELYWERDSDAGLVRAKKEVITVNGEEISYEEIEDSSLSFLTQRALSLCKEFFKD